MTLVIIPGVGKNSRGGIPTKLEEMTGLQKAVYAYGTALKKEATMSKAPGTLEVTNGIVLDNPDEAGWYALHYQCIDGSRLVR